MRTWRSTFQLGQNDRPAQPGKPAQAAAFGSFMLKVSWKILTPEEIAAKTFHMRRALVLMPRARSGRVWTGRSA